MKKIEKYKTENIYIVSGGTEFIVGVLTSLRYFQCVTSKINQKKEENLGDNFGSN
jgi:hypothetical protein